MGISEIPQRQEGQQSHEEEAQSADLVWTLAGINASGETRLAHKTRRLVHGAVLNIRQRKVQSKRSLALVMTVIAATLVVLAPVIWNAVDHLLGESHFGDISTQMSLLLLFALPALLAALLLMGRTLHHGNRDRRHL